MNKRHVSKIFDDSSAEEGVNCKDLLTSQDKVEIVKATYDYIAGKDGLWNRLL